MREFFEAGNIEAVTDRPSESYGIWRAWYALIVFEIQILAAGVDIAIVTLLVHPIETALRINDVEFAMITTISVTIGSALCQYPAGLLADVFRRRDVIAAGSLIWAVAALVAARVDSGNMFFVARLLAGMGIGITGPAMFSMISDAFPRTRRGFALSSFIAGISIGIGVGLAICGVLAEATNHFGTLRLGAMSFSPWQQCFIAVAAIGIVSLVLILTVREPPRLERANSTDTSANLKSNLRIFGGYLRQHWILWSLVFIGASIGGASYAGISAWAPAFGMRHFGISGASPIALLGTFVAGGSLIGSVVGGLLAQRSINHGNPRTLPRMIVVVSLIYCVFAVGFPYMPSWPLAVTGIGRVYAASMAQGVLILVGIQETTPNEFRGQLLSVYNIIGSLQPILGVSVIAYLASGLLAKAGGLGPAMALVGGITSVIAALMIAFCSGAYERARKEMQALVSRSRESEIV